MLQVVQYQKNGEISVSELPIPALKKGWILVRNLASVISSGTERTSVETAQASMIGKAKSRPDLVKQVLENINREGLLPTYKKVQNRLDNFKELGYCSSGIVIESLADDFKVGDRVACAGYSHHAEVISVPQNLAVKIHENTPFDQAAFATLGAIALQGIRQAEIKIGEYVAVIGLGLVGLITVQLLNANGCRVIGLDINESNFELAKSLGCIGCYSADTTNIKNVENITLQKGVDSVIITASTNSNSPVDLAAAIARKKAKVIIVGRVGMNLPYSDSYNKELDFRMSCSYGPGRYDTGYEEDGLDYPYDYVRWTENRNMQTIVDLLEDRKIDFNCLISHKFNISDALKAYEIITSGEKHLGIVLEYPDNENFSVKKITKVNKSLEKKTPSIGFIGAGNFAQSYLLPALKTMNADLRCVSTSVPVNSMAVAKKFDFQSFTADAGNILTDKDINTVFIATRHDSHSRFVLEALRNKKNVYVEKPLCIDKTELMEIIDVLNENDDSFLMVGYNRRFSDQINLIKDFFSSEDEAMMINYRINAGFIPKTNWYQNPKQNGRIIGEVCHFVDTVSFLTGSSPVKIFSKLLKDKHNRYTNDNMSTMIEFENGSVANIQYLANGSKKIGKEYLEVFSSGKTAVMDDFKRVELYSENSKKIKKYSGGKGHSEEVKKVYSCITEGKTAPIPVKEILLTSLTTFSILDSINNREEISVKLIA